MNISSTVFGNIASKQTDSTGYYITFTAGWVSHSCKCVILIHSLLLSHLQGLLRYKDLKLAQGQ